MFRSGGKGGQHQNVTESGVRLTHLPTGVVVTSRRFRSQLANKRKALVALREKLTALNESKKRRIPTQIPRRVQKRRLSLKQRHSSKKTLRQKPKLDDD